LINRAIKKTTAEIRIVEENGKQNDCPKRVNRTSPGKRPTPNFFNQGSNVENTIKPIKMARTHRIIFIPFL